MKALMFSTDSSILESGSQAQGRMIEYGSLAEKLFIVVLSKKLVNSRVLDISPNTKVYSAWFWSAWNLGKKFKNQGINLVTSQDPFETGLIGYRAARRLKARLQLQIHTDFLNPYFLRESFKNKVRVFLAKRLLPKADSIRVVSQRIKDSLSKVNCQLSKVVVLPIFVDIAKIQSTLIGTDLRKKYSQFDFIILMASRLTREKNIAMAIRAMSEAAKTNPKAGLIIVGEGSEKNNLRLETRNSKLETSVIFEPWTNDLVSYYKTADVFLNTSNYEGYGRTLIEAASAGCPLITTDVGLVGEAINKNNSLIVPVGDAAALAQSILKLIESKNLQQELGQKAKDAVRGLGDKESYLQKYKQSWQTVM